MNLTQNGFPLNFQRQYVGHDMAISDRGTGNKIVINESIHKDLKITINGNNNIINIADFKSGQIYIEIHDDNNKIEVMRMRRAGTLRIISKNSGSVFIGESSTIEGLYILAAGAGVKIGRDCMISFNVTIRTYDAHGIYDLETGDITNLPAPIEIEDHVWLAQGVIVTGGSTIGKNSILGSQAYVSGKEIKENSLAVGTPARILRENVVWDRRMTPNIYADDAEVDEHLWKSVARKKI
jgi:acetyltransferase-like isoleucine patch superfamily enzyme